MKKNKRQSIPFREPSVTPEAFVSTPADFIHRVLVHGLGLLGLLISVCFFTATYDTAQVKLTLLQMGGITLLFLWAAAQITRRENPFTRARLPFLLPVFVYIGWHILCYALAPYHLEAAEEFFNFLLYGGITLLAATELKTADLRTLTCYLIAAACLSFAYAGVQVVNIFHPGFDPVDWHGFFPKRVFSTHTNPNFFADFAVFSSCIIATAYTLSRKKGLIVLLGIGAVSLYFTESKGAWGAYAFCVAFAVLAYTNTLASGVKKHLKTINAAALTFVLAVGILVSYFTVKRFQSVSFRTHTWLSTYEMIKDSPVFGVGTGNFKVIYSAYKRPQIFYIEKAHNVETQHAENELLEQAAVAGLPGLAIFLWLMGFVFYAAWQGLKRYRKQAGKREQTLYLLGYTTALAGIFVHSWVDISIHFASGGYFFALFLGVVLSLLLPPAPQVPTEQNRPGSIVAWGLRLVLTGLWVTLLVLLIIQFREITAPVVRHTLTEHLLLYISWAVLVGTLLAAGYGCVRSALGMRRQAALMILCLVPPLLYALFGAFRSNHYYSLAVLFAQLHKPDGSLIYFTRAIKGNPLKAEYYQFRGNLLATRMRLNESFSKDRGDKKEPSNDFKSALKDFTRVEKSSPNHPLLHHNRGQLYYQMALRRSDDATHAQNDAQYMQLRQEALDNMAKAKKSFERALVSDPVNEETYAFLIQIGLLENNLDAAQKWIERYEQGPQGVTEPEFLEPLKNNPRMHFFRQQIAARRASAQ